MFGDSAIRLEFSDIVSLLTTVFLMKTHILPSSFALLAALALTTMVHAAAPDELPAPELTEVWTPIPPVVSASSSGIPSDAIVLFDGKNLDEWEPVRAGGAPWKIEGDAMVITPTKAPAPSVDHRTKKTFGDIQLHLEFRTPAKVNDKGQGRGNSGVFFMGLYELQVLDSYENPTYSNGQVGSIYKQHIPLANAARPPGEWQTYDVVFIAPRFSAEGRVLSPARLTAFHNGVLIQYDVEIKGPTTYRGPPKYEPHAAKLPLVLQDHRNPTAFRNIWVREITLPNIQ
jgi:hypothetical protein